MFLHWHFLTGPPSGGALHLEGGGTGYRMKGTLNHVPITLDRDVIESRCKNGSSCDDRPQTANIQLTRQSSTYSLLFFIFLHFHRLFQVIGRCKATPLWFANDWGQFIQPTGRWPIELLLRRELEGGRRSSAPNDLQKTIKINTNCHRSPADIDRVGAAL